MRQAGVDVQALRPLRGRADARAWTPTPPYRDQRPPKKSQKKDLGTSTVRLDDGGATDKQGSTLIRWAAVEAVQRIPVTAGWLVAPRAQISARRGRNIATVAVARRLLTLVYYGLRDGHIRALRSPERNRERSDGSDTAGAA
jgi:hypothetical protein